MCTDAHLSRRALHDGRAVGRLRPDEHRAGPVRARRGELLRPGRQPSRRLCAHARARRRLLRAAVHDRRLPGSRCSASPRCRSTIPRSKTPSAQVDEQVHELLSVNGNRTVDDIPPRARQGALGQLRHGTHRAESRARRCRRSPPSARSSGKDVRVLGEAKPATSLSRRPAGSPTSSNSANSWSATPCTATKAAAATSVRSTRPKMAKRCATTNTSAMSRLGSSPASATDPELHKEPLEFEIRPSVDRVRYK